MSDADNRAIAIVGLGAILPDAPTASTFWENVRSGRYSITDVREDRWDPAVYYDPDPAAPDKTYSKIGGWVRDWEWEPLKWRLPIPPRVADAMDDGQKWAVACTRQVLADFGYPDRTLDPERTAVVLGNAMAGEKHYFTALRIFAPELARALEGSSTFAGLSASDRQAIADEARAALAGRCPEITEDTMPGELSNCLAGRIANLFDFHGPNFVCDAACASGLAAISAGIGALIDGECDALLTGGIDRNMGVNAFVKFCKIGALSATGTRPYADGADGFVMGEGAAMFLLRRLEDAERDGDRIYAVLRGIAGSSDGKGKGITAPNPIGQRLAIERAWKQSGISLRNVGMIEGHGTSTRVGDVVEVESLAHVLGSLNLAKRSVALGSVKSNIGHLKAAAGAAGLLKAVQALHAKELPPSLHFDRPNPNIDFSTMPLAVNETLREWPSPSEGVRCAGVSAFGFGGTNFHVVVEEYVPGRIRGGREGARVSVPAGLPRRTPPRGAAVLGAGSESELRQKLDQLATEARGGHAAPPAPPSAGDVRAPERVAIDYGDANELADKAGKALKALDAGNPAMWKALRGQGVFRGSGPAGAVAFLYPGQGSQYVGMLGGLRADEPIVQQTFAEADRVMEPLLGRPLSDFVFAAPGEAAEEALKQTEVTQPAVLAVDLALTRLLEAHGIEPDMVMGHSLGEYGALVAAGAFPFEDALEAVSARGREMASIEVPDNGKMAAVLAPLHEVERIVGLTEGNVVIANINSRSQSVIGGASDAVDRAVELCENSGYRAVYLPVSHAFHTSIVAPASEPLRQVLSRLRLTTPSIPLVANVTGGFYSEIAANASDMVGVLARQVAEPVQFVKGLETLYAAGARVFVEVGPKRALQGFVDDVLADRADAVSLYTNHPKSDDATAFNQALCGLWAAGVGAGATEHEAGSAAPAPRLVTSTAQAPAGPDRSPAVRPQTPRTQRPAAPVGRAVSEDRYTELGHLFADVLERGARLLASDGAAPEARAPVVVSGASLGLPGGDLVFDDAKLGRILRGEQFIEPLPADVRARMLDKHITRLVKSEEGEASFETIDDPSDVIKLAGRGGRLDLASEFGIDEDLLPALDVVTQLAIAAGIDALRDAGLPLVMRYRTTHKGTQLPDSWGLPEELQDDTGVVFASAFPGYDALVSELESFHADRTRRIQIAMLDELLARTHSGGGGPLVDDLCRRREELQQELDRDGYVFDRRFLFRVLSMGHSQFAELIGARGPNTQVNSACASSTQAMAVAEDWIRSGRCRRVVIIAGDDVTSEHLIGWIGSGFLASGAAATDERVEDAALPFDRRRHGTILGMGAAGIVVEDPESTRERGLAPICQLLGATTANSAYHGTRLDVDHICSVMESVVAQAEQRSGVSREEMAASMVFVSHETYTPARGGSASAEVFALRRVFGPAAERIVIANTKGFTGHAMGVGIEDVVAIKSLESGLVPPVANFREVDPDLGTLNLSRGGSYDVEYALRLGAGFGSQISMTLMRRVPAPDGRRHAPEDMGWQSRLQDPGAWNAWLTRVAGSTAIEVERHTLRVRDGGARSTPAPTPEPTTRAAPAAPMAPPDDEVRTKVLEIVAEKTGYPSDMLELDLDLEADLGIDTVKQAETFAAIRGAYDIPRDEKLKLKDYPTLQHAIEFVYERRPDLGRAAPPAPTPAPAPAAEIPAAAATTPAHETADDPVRARVLEIVEEKTGYPSDMLELDLDLEADLGIDTVKQAETFAAIRGAYDIPRDEKLKLKDYPTLQHAIEFVYERRPDLRDTPGTTTAAPGAEHAETADAEAAVEVPRRVVAPVVRPALDLCKPTRVALGDGARVLVFADRGGVGRALRKKLEKRGVECVWIDDAPKADELRARLESVGPIQGVYWLPALDAEGDLADLSFADWREALRVRVKLLYATMRTLYESIGRAESFLVSATRMGGRHGYDPDGASAPMGGGVVGFTKAFARERPEALVKAVDFEADARPAAIAELLIAETETDPGIVEVGHRGRRRSSPALVERDAAEEAGPGLTLGADTSFVVTGAAGAIVAAIVGDLAKASGGTFHLLDLTPAPDPADPDLSLLDGDRDSLRRILFERLQASGERATPARVERQIAALERAKCALAAIEAVRAAGGTAHYHAVDLRDGDAVAGVVEKIRDTTPRVDVLVHAAGLEVSRFLPDKEPEEFDRVFDVKADGWFHLARGLDVEQLRATVVFSSIAGRFGNGGQCDYSAANDLLCKSVSRLRARSAETLGIAIDWTAWARIGMASRGSVPLMMERAGIDMLAPDAGIPVVRRELEAGARAEVLVAGRLGLLVEERDESGGLDPSAVDVSEAGPMVTRVLGAPLHRGLVVEARLDPAAQAFLHDHQIDGTPVLPGVMGIEAFVEASRLSLPDAVVTEVEDVEFLAPFKFYRGEPRSVEVSTQLREDGDGWVADCRLVGRRTLVGQTEPRETLHFVGRVRLAAKRSRGKEKAEAPQVDDAPTMPRDAVYETYFHGPAYQVLSGAWVQDGRTVGKLEADLPPDHTPPDAPTLSSPRLLELCFQTAGMREVHDHHRLALPRRVGRVRSLREAGKRGAWAVVRPGAEPDTFDAVVVDDAGNVLLTLEGYATIAAPAEDQARSAAG